MITLDSRITLSNTVITQEISGELALYDTASDKCYGLNPIGARFWQLLQEDGSLRRAHDRLLNEFDVSPDQLQTDLLTLINQMANAGLLSYEDPG